MPMIDCPWCDGAATVDLESNTVGCAGCAITIDIAPDPATRAHLGVAA